jgi:glycine/D-amino acid oxidase-like deaminating enzyme
MMRTRYGIAPWIHEFPSTRRPAFPQLRGEHVADVVIVGGGLTGCATAYACAVAGLRPIVLEGRRVGEGSAGRSAGLLLPEPGPAFRDVAQAHGLRAARRVFELWAKGASDGAAVLRRLKVGGGVDAFASLAVAFRGEDKGLQRDFAARKQAGLDVHWLAPRHVRQTTALEASAAMRLHDAFAVDPYRASVTLANAASRRGARLFERSAVRKARFGRKQAEVVLADGIVRAGAVVVTTGVATPEFQPLRRHFKLRETYLVLTDVVPVPVRRQLGTRKATLVDTRTPRHRIRWTRDDRILVAGADQDAPAPRGRDAVLVQRTGQLMYELLTMYPAISGLAPAYGWDMPYGDTADGLMYVGAHRNYPRHLFALGAGGDSITGAFVAARLLVRALRGEAQRGDDVFGWTR